MRFSIYAISPFTISICRITAYIASSYFRIFLHSFHLTFCSHICYCRRHFFLPFFWTAISSILYFFIIDFFSFIHPSIQFFLFFFLKYYNIRKIITHVFSNKLWNIFRTQKKPRDCWICLWSHFIWFVWNDISFLWFSTYFLKNFFRFCHHYIMLDFNFFSTFHFILIYSDFIFILFFIISFFFCTNRD